MQKNTCMADISYDVRTAMNNVIGFAKLAKMRSGDDEKLKYYLDNICDSGLKVMDILEAALTDENQDL